MAERQKCLNVLGLSSGASEDEIKKAYKKLALQVHPDKNDSHDANEKFQELSQAYNYLTKGDATNLQDNNDDARAEFFRRMFAEMFMPPPFFFSNRGGFPFFCDPFECDDDDNDYYDDGYYYSSDSSDGWRPNIKPEFDRRQGDQYKFSHTNASHHGPEMSSKQIRKKEKRRRQRARQKERKENKPNGAPPPGTAQKKSPKPGSRYTDEINNSEANKENKDRNRQNVNTGGQKPQTDSSKPRSTSGPQSTESKVNTEKTERASTPVRQDQQKMTKNLKKKMESEQRKREKEMEEIAAQLLRQQEEKQEKQRRKEEQEREQREKEKKEQSSTGGGAKFEPFHEFHMPEPKSRKQKKRERKKEEESARSTEDQCPLPTDKKHSFEEPAGFGQPKVSPFGPIGSKIPQTGSGASDNTGNLPKSASSSKQEAKAEEVHPPWYNPYHDEKSATNSRTGSQSQPKYNNNSKPQQKPAGKHKDSGHKPSSSFSVPYNKFEILDMMSDGEESSDGSYESDSGGQSYDYIDTRFHTSAQPSQPATHVHSTTNSGDNNYRAPGGYPGNNQPSSYPEKTTKQQLPNTQPSQFTNQTHKFAQDSIHMDRSTRNQNGYDALDDFDIGTSCYGNSKPTGAESNFSCYGNSSTSTGAASNSGLYGNSTSADATSNSGSYGNSTHTGSASKSGPFGNSTPASSASKSGLYSNSTPAGAPSNSGRYGNSSPSPSSVPNAGNKQKPNAPTDNYRKQEKPAESAHPQFGQNRSAPGFGGNPGRGRGGFGEPPPPKNGGGFGEPQPPKNGGGFGQPPPPKNGGGFGQPPPPKNGGGFGQQPQPKNGGFGQPPQPKNGGFGQPPQPKTGGFGQPPQPKTGGGYGQPQSPQNGGGFGQPRNGRPIFGHGTAPPMNGYGPGPRPGPRPGPPPQRQYTPPQGGYNQHRGQFNSYSRPPGFATHHATPRPQAFTSQGGYHDIGRNSPDNYGNLNAQNMYVYGDLGNQTSFGNKKPGDDLNVNGFREGQRREVNNRSNSNNKFGANSPSFGQQRPEKPVPSVNKSNMKGPVNSYDSLDSLDDFPIPSEKSKSGNLVNDDFDLSNMSMRFEGVLGKEELNVPGAMFSDNIKNYYH